MASLNIPKRDLPKFGSLERECGLIEGCKYMLYFADGFGLANGETSVPCRSKKEALYFLRVAVPSVIERGA